MFRQAGIIKKSSCVPTTAQVVATASFNVGVPAYGQVQITKTGTNGAALAGVKFGIYSDSGCSSKIGELTTGSDGTATSGNLSVGTVYIKELSTVSPYVMTAEVKAQQSPQTPLQNVAFTNTVATVKSSFRKGRCADEQGIQETEYGTVSVPAYSAKGLKGVVYEIKNSGGSRSWRPLHQRLRHSGNKGVLPLGTLHRARTERAPRAIS
jgi:uncharacterized surface anchored protein